MGKPARVLDLVPPREGGGVAALLAQQAHEDPDVVPVPGEEQAVHVDGRGHLLVHRHEVFVPVRGPGEVARRRRVHQALDAIEERLPVPVVHVAPLHSDVRRRAGAAGHGRRRHVVRLRGGRRLGGKVLLGGGGLVVRGSLGILERDRLEPTERVQGHGLSLAVRGDAQGGHHGGAAEDLEGC